MTIHKIEQVPFAQIANEAIRDKRLSFRARGILALVLSHSEDWEATRDWLLTQTEKEGRAAVQTALNELSDLGYRVVEKSQNEGGLWATIVHWKHLPETDSPTDGDTDRPETRLSDNTAVNKNTITEHHKEHHKKNTSSSADANDDANPEAERLANLFSQLLTDLNVKHQIGKQWVTDLDRMMRLDGRTPAEVEGAMRWALADDFWKSNIHSPRKLRARFDQLRLQAQRGRSRVDAGRDLIAHYEALEGVG